MQRIAVSTVAEFDALQPQWEALYAGDPTAQLFLSRPWLSAYFATTPYPWTILALSENDRLVGALPISIRSAPHPRFPVGRELTFSAQGFADYNGMLALAGQESAVVRELAAWIAGLPWERVRFEDATDVRLRALCDVLGSAGARTDGPPQPCYYIELPASYETFLARLGAGTRRATLSGERRIAKLLPTARIARAEPADLGSSIDGILRVNRLRWGGSAIRERRYRRLLHAAYATGAARFHVVWDGARAIAGCASFVDPVRGTYAMWLFGHDPDYRHLNPGRALLSTVFAEAIRDGFRQFDFLRGDDEYKQHYATGQRTNFSYVIERAGPRAALLRAAQTFYGWARSAAVAVIVRPKRAAKAGA